jgi:hypothetical protein
LRRSSGQNNTEVLELASSVISFLTPKPAPVGLMRVGGNRDGAYLVPKGLNGVVACFSPGVANRKDFEDELLSSYGIRSHLLDGSSDVNHFRTPLREGFQTFQKKWLSPETSSISVSLDDWVRDAETEPETDLILQMDIEGAEYENLLATSRSILERFRVVIIEFHGVHSMILGSKSEREILRATLLHLSETFVSVHARANNCCPIGRVSGLGARIPEVLEVTLLRKDQFSVQTRMRRPQIPHILDIKRNVGSKKPLHLGKSWNEHSSFFLPVIKIMMDWSSFLVEILDRSVAALTDRFYVMVPGRVRRELARMRFWRSG